MDSYSRQERYEQVGEAMLLDLQNRECALPDNLHFFACSEIQEPGTWGGGIPRGFVTLEKSMWPDEVQGQITLILKAIGVPDPMKQKLVHPAAFAFGGRQKEGELDLSAVNWEAVVDYYRYEAAQWTENKEEAARIQKVALKKYGQKFSHVAVYDIY